MSNQELTAWTFLGGLYIFCAIVTVFISGSEK